MEPGTIDRARICGTWRLVSATAVDTEGRSLRPPYGPEPMGRLVLTEQGRMMAVLCDGRTTVPDGEPRAYSSYCGNFRVEDGALVTTVDAAAATARIGSEQRRAVEFRGDDLVLRPGPRPNGEQRELLWRRDGPG